MEPSSDSSASSGPPRQEVEPFFTPEHINNSLDRAKRILNRIQQSQPTYVLTKGDLAVIFENSQLDALSRRMSGRILNEEIKSHQVFAELYLSSQPKNPPGTDKSRRVASKATKALARDAHMCIITGFSNPQAAHIFPFAALSSTFAVQQTFAAADIMRSLMGKAFYNRYKDRFNKKKGFETEANIGSITPLMHHWLDRGFWAFKTITSDKTNIDSDHYNALKLCWLPGCFSDDSKYPSAIDDSGLDQFVSRLAVDLKKAYDDGFQPRRPSKGNGVIGAYRWSGEPVESGQIFEVKHDTTADKQLFGDMIHLQWRCLRILALAGIADAELPGEDSGNNNDDNNDGPQDDNDDGHHKDDLKRGKESPPPAPPSPTKRARHTSSASGTGWEDRLQQRQGKVVQSE
ncbi:hypothetical protein SNK03_002516 [Fusarium graminearum]